MESKSIYRKLFLVILLSGIISYLESCTDSLGLDPNVKVTSVVDGGSDTTGGGNGGGGGTTIKPYKISKFDLRVFETFRFQNKKYYEEWFNPITISDIIIDTSDSKIKLNLNFEIQNPKKDAQLEPRHDRIIKSDLKFSGFILEESDYSLNNNYPNYNSIKVDIETKDQPANIIRFAYGFNNDTYLKIERINTFDKIIDIIVEFKPIVKFETEKLSFALRLFY